MLSRESLSAYYMKVDPEDRALRKRDSLWPSLSFPGGSAVKNLPATQERQETVRSLGQVDSLEKGMATHSSILAWRIPRTEEPGGL